MLQEFQQLVSEIRALGYDEKTAADYAALIGTAPVLDEKGRVVVIDGDQELARLALPSFN